MITPEERKKRLQKCGRHRSLFTAPDTPPGFWDVDFPSQSKKAKDNGIDDSL